MARSRLTRRDWIIRLIAIVVVASFLLGLVAAILTG